jgi:hypothetical protein
MKLKTLAWLLFNANSGCKSRDFYALKKEILKKFGVCDGYDIQFIEGKKCYTCGGNGKYWNDEECWNCTDGWYKQPFYSVLERRKIDTYIFHIPLHKSVHKGGLQPNIIGYIEHSPTPNHDECLEVLFDLHKSGQLFNVN